MNITKIIVYQHKDGPDLVNVFTDMPSAFPACDNDNLILNFTTQRGIGAEYVRNNFKIEPKVENV